jgi:hypothetical protein
MIVGVTKVRLVKPFYPLVHFSSRILPFNA